jgi:hypothetical protein
MFVEVRLRRYKDNNQSAHLQFVHRSDRIVVVTGSDRIVVVTGSDRIVVVTKRERKRLHDTR